MEQYSRYWLQTSRRTSERPPVPGPRMLHVISEPGSLYYAESWEERAFAEDSAGLLGGCTWPPRSYTCSFCRREFRSAQALGGHMNVHRRDRARLKQSSSSGSEGTTIAADHDHHRNHCKGMNASGPHQISLQYDAEPTSNPSNYTTLVPSSLSSTTLLSPSFSSSETQEKLHAPSYCDAPKSINPRHEQIERGENLTAKDTDYHMPRNLCRDDEAAVVSIKRQRIGGAFSSSSIQLPAERSTHEVLKLIPSAVEELDLELRLGCSSKYKVVVCLSN